MKKILVITETDYMIIKNCIDQYYGNFGSLKYFTNRRDAENYADYLIETQDSDVIILED